MVHGILVLRVWPGFSKRGCKAKNLVFYCVFWSSGPPQTPFVLPCGLRVVPVEAGAGVEVGFKNFGESRIHHPGGKIAWFLLARFLLTRF